MERLVDELLGIMTGEVHTTGAFRTIAAGLASRLAKPTDSSTSIPDTLLQLARTTTNIQQIQDNALQAGTHKNNAVFQAYEKVIGETEAILAREVQSSQIGPRVAGLLATSTNRTPFTAYLANGGARQAQWAMHEGEPSDRQEGQFDRPTEQGSPIRRAISSSPRTRSPSRPCEDKSFESSESEDYDSAPDSVFGHTTATPILHHPVSERCRNHAKGSCNATSCTRWHGKSNP
jgi:hypothetical protein